MINEAIDFVTRRKVILKSIKENSPYFPQFGIFPVNDQVFISTLVRIEKEGVWYTVHCAQDFKPDISDVKVRAIQRLLTDAYNVKLFWKFSGIGMEEKDPCQESEEERVKKQMGY